VCPHKVEKKDVQSKGKPFLSKVPSKTNGFSSPVELRRNFSTHRIKRNSLRSCTETKGGSFCSRIKKIFSEKQLLKFLRAAFFFFLHK